jgi:hypothetical protein
MRVMRGRASLRSLEKRQSQKPRALVISKSQLSRYEQGLLLPPLDYADHLDDLYAADGWVSMSLKALWRPRWTPWVEEFPAQFHHGGWPAEYHGSVWIKLLPIIENVGNVHTIDLEWGPWGRRVVEPLPRTGLILVTGKMRDADGISRTCNLASDLHVYALFGAGEGLEGEEVRMIHRGWELRNVRAGADEQGHGPAR